MYSSKHPDFQDTESGVVWCGVVWRAPDAKTGGPSHRSVLRSTGGSCSSSSRRQTPGGIVHKARHDHHYTMWALRLLASLRLLLLLLVLPTTTTNAAVIPFNNGAGSSPLSTSSRHVMCRPKLSGLVQQIRKSGDCEFVVVVNSLSCTNGLTGAGE